MKYRLFMVILYSMKLLKRIYLLVISISLTAEKVIAQDITGSWAGIFNGEYMQVNVEQRNNELCGHTYDYELNDSSSFCMARFQGRYDADKQIYFIAGNSFIKNSGNHVLMRIILWKSREDGRNSLRGKVYVQNTVMSIFGMGGDEIFLKRISNKPKKLPGIPECFPELKKQPKPAPVKDKPVVVKKQAVDKPVTPKTTKDSTSKKDSSLREINSLPQKISPPVTQPEKTMASRKQSRQSRLTVDVNVLNLKLYDNGTVDNDSISIFYNGRLLLSHQRLSDKAIELTIQLDESVSTHEITLFAENLGSIPPNTALVVVTAGDKRYELRSKASLDENAVLVFDYKPK